MKRFPACILALGTVALLACEDESASTCCGTPDGGVFVPEPTAPPPPGAGPTEDGGADGSAPTPTADVVDPSLDHAELPADLASAAALPVGEGDGALPGARTYEDVTANVSSATIARTVESRPAREVTVLIRWGTIPPAPTPSVGAWADFSGFVAVADGELELVRPLRWASASDPAAARPNEFVAPQSDARLIRFRSFIGAGSTGLALRIRRSTIRPVVLTLSVNGITRSIPLEMFLGQSIVAGGWNVAVGNVQFDSSVPNETEACYVQTGTMQGAWSFVDGTTLQALTGSVARTGAPSEELRFTAGETRGPYGNYTGTLGGAPLVGFYGKASVFGTFAKEGRFIGRIDGANQELFLGAYEGVAVNGRVFRRSSCDEPGAAQKNLFRF